MSARKRSESERCLGGIRVFWGVWLRLSTMTLRLKTLGVFEKI